MSKFELTRILICDDDQSFRERLSKSFISKGIETMLASSTEDAKEKLKSAEVELDAAIIDLRMPGESGLVMLKLLIRQFPHIRAMVLTGYGSIHTAMEAVRLGAHNYITKPTSFQTILSALYSAPGQTSKKEAAPSLEEVEMEYVNRVLDENSGNISRTAKVLGLHRRSLQRKLARL